MTAGPKGVDPRPRDEVVGDDVRELLAADDERAPADLHAVVAAMAREAQGLPRAAAVPSGAPPRWQRLVPIAAVLALSVGVVPLVVRDVPTVSESVAPANAPAPVVEADRAAARAGAAEAVVPEALPAEAESAPEVSAPGASVTAESFDAPAPARDGPSDGASRARSSGLAARSPGVDGTAVPALPPIAMQKTRTPRDGARRVIERLRARGVDAALESYAIWRALWPEADLAELVGDAGEDELERLREAIALRGLPPLSPVP